MYLLFTASTQVVGGHPASYSLSMGVTAIGLWI